VSGLLSLTKGKVLEGGGHPDRLESHQPSIVIACDPFE